MKLKLIKQRIERGYNDEDVYSLNNYFLEVFIPALKQLRDTKHGIPQEFITDKKGNAIDLNIAHDNWINELNTMIDHFEKIDLFSTDTENNKYHITEGFKLFAKYFENLWD